MRPLIVLSARSAAVAMALVLAVGLASGLVRLLPWLVSPDVPWQLAWPFARLLGGAALEITLLLGLPLGAALGAAIFVERGEARALASLGASPGRMIGALFVPGLVLTLLYVLLASTTDPEPPGRFATRLVDAGRASCGRGGGRDHVEVPLVGVTWLCFAGRSGRPLLSGRVPGLPDGAWFTATDFRPSAELRTASLDGLHLTARLGTRVLGLHVRDARLTGLPGWGRSLAVSGATRGGVIGSGALVAALAAAWLVVRRSLASPIAAAGVSGAAALGMLLVLRLADAGHLRPAAYVLVPISGLFSLVLAAGGLALGARIAGHPGG